MTSTILAASDISYGVSGPLQVVSWILGLAVLGASIYTAIDANKYSDQAHQAAGAPKMLWVVGAPIAGVIGCACCFILGAIMPALWFGVYKKKADAAQGGGYGAGFGGPQPYGGPPAGGPPGGFPPPAGPPGGFPPPPAGGTGGFPPPPGQ